MEGHNEYCIDPPSCSSHLKGNNILTESFLKFIFFTICNDRYILEKHADVCQSDQSYYDTISLHDWWLADNSWKMYSA